MVVAAHISTQNTAPIYTKSAVHEFQLQFFLFLSYLRICMNILVCGALEWNGTLSMKRDKANLTNKHHHHHQQQNE